MIFTFTVLNFLGNIFHSRKSDMRKVFVFPERYMLVRNFLGRCVAPCSTNNKKLTRTNCRDKLKITTALYCLLIISPVDKTTFETQTRTTCFYVLDCRHSSRKVQTQTKYIFLSYLFFCVKHKLPRSFIFFPKTFLPPTISFFCERKMCRMLSCQKNIIILIPLPEEP